MWGGAATRALSKDVKPPHVKWLALAEIGVAVRQLSPLSMGCGPRSLGSEFCSSRNRDTVKPEPPTRTCDHAEALDQNGTSASPDTVSAGKGRSIRRSIALMKFITAMTWL